MQQQTLKVMAVDDDEINLEILIKNLKDSGYQSIGFEDGEAAWKYLSQHPEDVDIVLLDKMMPKMDGIQVLDKMKSHEILRNIPVIIQTGDVAQGNSESDRLKSNLIAGAYYYLEKPFDPTVMVSLINAAARDCVRRNEIFQQIKVEASISDMLREGVFHVRTVEDANKLAAALAHHAQKSQEAGVTLAELMVNAVEHGNLGIGYEMKGRLVVEGRLEDEITHRLSLDEHKDKRVVVKFLAKGTDVIVTIIDQGQGFDWKNYLEFDPIRLTDPNGRGIAAAHVLNTSIEYLGDGNKVICSFKAKQH